METSVVLSRTTLLRLSVTANKINVMAFTAHAHVLPVGSDSHPHPSLSRQHPRVQGKGKEISHCVLSGHH